MRIRHRHIDGASRLSCSYYVKIQIHLAFLIQQIYLKMSRACDIIFPLYVKCDWGAGVWEWGEGV
jgi:hypothetical protein